MQTRDIFPEWGTEITDMSDLLQQDPRELRHMLYNRRMIVLHAPAWRPFEFYEFCKLWGEPWDNKKYTVSTEIWKPTFNPFTRERGYYTEISNKLSKRLNDYEMPWHADIANRVDGGVQFPHRVIYMRTVPNPLAGYTIWLDMEHAYPQLPESLRKRWEAVTVVQQNWHHPGRDIIEWPSMKQHPVTGRWSPRCNFHGVADSWIINLKLNGHSIGTGLVEELMTAMMEMPNAVYEHRWVPNDIVLYDNTPSVHRRTNPGLKEGEVRLMWRANIEHDLSLADKFQASNSVSQ